MNIVMSCDVDGFFKEALASAMSTQKVTASPTAIAYLVGVLAEFAHPDQPVAKTLERPMTFLLREALQAPPAERLGKLKDVGDSTLYVSGFFAEHLEARGVEVGYVSRLGATAYSAAGQMLQHGDGNAPDLFKELADQFERFVAVIREVSDSFLARGAQNASALLKVYERWLKTGSGKLAETLGTYGLVPVKAVGGIQ
jgi:hypothetical protein